MKNKKELLREVNLFVLDMDGTVYLGNRLIKGSDIFIQKIKDRDRDLIFFTNNASKTAKFYLEKLKQLGIYVDLKDIVTSGDVTIEYLKQYYPNKRVYLNGTPLLKKSFSENGICLVEEDPDIVIQSFDTTMTYEKIRKITNFVREGVPFISTHCDINCPTEDGYIPDSGAICSMITASTGVKPRYLGKPMKETVEMILQITNHHIDEIAFVGDRIYTDVATGVNNGAKGFLVLTGESDEQTVQTSKIQPTGIFKSLLEMSKYI